MIGACPHELYEPSFPSRANSRISAGVPVVVMETEDKISRRSDDAQDKRIQIQ